jgi:hypothetical protein
MKYIRVSRTSFYKLIKEGMITPYGADGFSDKRFKREELDALFRPVILGENEGKDHG